MAKASWLAKSSSYAIRQRSVAKGSKSDKYLGLCALSIASFIGQGDISFFVSIMNQEARKIGMHNSLFRNPCGLDEEDGGNLSSSYEMALLMRKCLDIPLFCEIVSSTNYQSSNHGVWHNKNKLINQYKFTTGGKTGVAPVLCEI